MRILVVTVVHHPQDARIYFRQMAALLANGHQVSYAAAFESFQVLDLDPRIETITLPRAIGKRRLSALLAVRKLLKQRSIDFDLVLLHDPELLIVASASKSPVVWDVHEDTAATIKTKSWIPSILKSPLRGIIAKLEARAEKKFNLILAETEYQTRFKQSHPVIPNTTAVAEYQSIAPKSTVVYLGSVTKLRGGLELLELAAKLAPHQIRVEIIGSCTEPDLVAKINDAVAAGQVIWHGFVPNETARALLPGQLAGLSLLHDHPNYQVSQPTKIYEYLAAAIPVITTPLIHAANLVNAAGAGYVVEFNNIDQVVQTIIKLKADPATWQELGQSGYQYVVTHHNWKVDQEKFIRALEDFAAK